MPGTWNISIPAGDTLRTTLTWKTGDPPAPVDLSGYSADFVVHDEAGTVLLHLTDTDGITLGGATGTIALFAQTEGVEPGCYSYFLRLSNGDVTNPTETGPVITTLLTGEFGVE